MLKHYKQSRKLRLGRCWLFFLDKTRHRDKRLYLQHGTSVQRRGVGGFFWQADLHHAQYRCIHTRTQTSTQQVACDREHLDTEQQHSEVWREGCALPVGALQFYCNHRASFVCFFYPLHPPGWGGGAKVNDAHTATNRSSIIIIKYPPSKTMRSSQQISNTRILRRRRIDP